MGLVDSENQAAAGQEIAARQQAMGPQIPGVPPGAGMGGGMAGPPPGGAAPADLNAPLTPDTFKPERIDLGR